MYSIFFFNQSSICYKIESWLSLYVDFIKKHKLIKPAFEESAMDRKVSKQNTNLYYIKTRYASNQLHS